ncbi:hypothetical protein BDZ89DRAFT_1040958 [Hymenopellis radicata]|nr:hypothetical protein BDZ89DRAFT_1040958 [Hymenopellis radicata]
MASRPRPSHGQVPSSGHIQAVNVPALLSICFPDGGLAIMILLCVMHSTSSTGTYTPPEQTWRGVYSEIYEKFGTHNGCTDGCTLIVQTENSAFLSLDDLSMFVMLLLETPSRYMSLEVSHAQLLQLCSSPNTPCSATQVASPRNYEVQARTAETPNLSRQSLGDYYRWTIYMSRGRMPRSWYNRSLYSSKKGPDCYVYMDFQPTVNYRRARPLKLYLSFKYGAVLVTKDCVLWWDIDNIPAHHPFAPVTFHSLDANDDVLDSDLETQLNVLLPKARGRLKLQRWHSSTESTEYLRLC